MTNLEKAAIEYADREVLQPWGLPNDTLKRYTIQDFTAGAIWYKENSKEKEMLEMLKKLVQIFRGLNVGPLANEIEDLIKEETTL